ncbi:MAG TPA: nicotinate-nucleotide--dimethylbenzimidazole phosphoribosyltransferase [Cyclobacteriaceae bacterium]
MKTPNILPVAQNLHQEIKHKIDGKAKPINSLGKLEELALTIAKIQNTTNPKIKNPHILVFAGDHGIATSGTVNAYPQNITAKMIHNFINGGAAINTFCIENNLSLKIIDAGVNMDFEPHELLINKKIGYGTYDYRKTQAMSKHEAEKAIEYGMEVIDEITLSGCNSVGIGEMGISNTSSASLITSIITGKDIEACVGAGAGLDQEGLQRKKNVLKKVIERYHISDDPMEVLSCFGGFEIAMMAGAYLAASEKQMVILVDGFISSAALLIAFRQKSDILDYCIFSHQSSEPPHQLILDYLNVEPILDLNLKLGEGTGAALAFPMVRNACGFLSNMADIKDL